MACDEHTLAKARDDSLSFMSFQLWTKLEHYFVCNGDWHCCLWLVALLSILFCVGDNNVHAFGITSFSTLERMIMHK